MNTPAHRPGFNLSHGAVNGTPEWLPSET